MYCVLNFHNLYILKLLNMLPTPKDFTRPSYGLQAAILQNSDGRPRDFVKPGPTEEVLTIQSGLQSLKKIKVTNKKNLSVRKQIVNTTQNLCSLRCVNVCENCIPCLPHQILPIPHLDLRVKRASHN